jgi:hypothetical protein
MDDARLRLAIETAVAAAIHPLQELVENYRHDLAECRHLLYQMRGDYDDARHGQVEAVTARDTWQDVAKRRQDRITQLEHRLRLARVEVQELRGLLDGGPGSGAGETA